MFSDVAKPILSQQMALFASMQYQQQQNLMRQANSNALRGAGIELTSVESSVPKEAGTMYVNDSFIASTPGEAYIPAAYPHGITVARAARGEGFRGPIVGTERATPAPTPVDEVWLDSLEGLGRPGQTAEQTITNIRSTASHKSASLLDQQSRYLKKLTRAGVSDSVVNLSLGASKAGAVTHLFRELLPALNDATTPPHPRSEQAKEMLKNIAGAGNLSTDKLYSKDAEIRNAERGRLSQFLIDQVSKGIDSDPTLANSRHCYNKAVRNFEALNNSVVVAAGNDGLRLKEFSEMHGNYRLKAPDDFSRNLLENSEVTSVGATEWTPGPVITERRADYSSTSSGVDVYAPGGTGLQDKWGYQVEGTSFAAPRVAATMAELHRRHRGTSSAGIERLLKQQLTQAVPDGDSTLDLLVYKHTSKLLASRTF